MSENYRMVKFGNVAKKVNNTVNLETTTLDKYVGGEHMNTDDLRIKEWGVLGDDYLGPAFNKIFKVGQILYGSRRTYLKKVAIPHFDGICANTTFVIEPTGKGLLAELVPFVMHSQAFTDHSIRESKGSTNPYVNWKDIAKYEFPVPADMERQKEIAEVLCAVELVCNKNEQFLSAAEQYKKIMMRELFHKGIGHKGYKTIKKFGLIPETWDYNMLDELAQQITVGIVVKPADYYVKNGIPALRSLNIQQDRIFSGDMVYISSTDNDTILSKSKLKEGDVLVVRTGYPGTSCVVPKEYEGANCVDLIIVRMNELLLNGYLSRYLNSSEGKKQILTRSAGLAQQHLNISEIKKLIIPYGSFEEQSQIVNILTQIDELINSARLSIKSTKCIKLRLINEYFPSKEEMQA